MMFARHGFGERLARVPFNRRWLLEVERDASRLQGYATRISGQTYEMGLDDTGRPVASADCAAHVPARVRAALARLLRAERRAF